MSAETYTVTTPTFAADTTAIASEVNANFTDILSGMNDFNAGNCKKSGTYIPVANITGLTTTQFAAATLVLESEGISSNDNDTTIPTCAAVKDYTDTKIAAFSGVVKAWVAFDGTDGTVAAQYNITSVNRDSAGVYTITWGTDFNGTSYALAGFVANNSALPGLVCNNTTDTPLAAGTAVIRTSRIDGALADYKLVTVIAIGYQ